MVKTGDIIEFTIPIKNNGNGNAYDVEVAVDIPTGLEYYSSSPDVGTYDSVAKKWSVGGMQPLENHSMQFKVKVLEDCELPATVTWVASSSSNDYYLSNNNGSYTITDSCCALRKCLEFLKYKHVWIDIKYGNDEAQLENILKPYSTVASAIGAINNLEDDTYKSNWHFHISGEIDSDIAFENLNGQNIIEFENFRTDNKLTFDNIGEELTLKGDMFKKGAGYVFEFAENLDLESIVLDIIIKRDTDGFAATQLGTPTGAGIWVKSALIESNKPFGVPVNGVPIVFKTI